MGILLLLIGLGVIAWLVFADRSPPEADWRTRATDAYLNAKSLVAQMKVTTPEEFAQSVWRELEGQFGDSFPALAVSAGVLDVAAALYQEEGLTADIEAPPDSGSQPAYALYIDEISSKVARLSNPAVLNEMRHAIVRSILNLAKYLPPLAMQPLHQILDPKQGMTVSLIEAMPKLAQAIQMLMAPFFEDNVIALGAFSGLRGQFDSNVQEVSGLSPGSHASSSKKLIMPQDFKGSASDMVRLYLKHTPFRSLLSCSIPFEIPQQTRFEHHWIVAGSGHGKTQTLQYLIGHDLERVVKQGATVVVIDSQGDLIKIVAGLKLFAPGQPLDGKLCFIDPTDIEYPVALNLFDVGMERLNTYSPLERERLLNGILELYDFVLGSLLSAELTQKQAVVFRYITRLMLHIPDATIHTFRELMEPRGYDKYRPYIDRLEGTARAFFETEFNSKQFEDTKRQVVRRLWGILENRTFERMFTHPRNKLDFFGEMNGGKVILINTAKELLKQTGTEIFGRFFIALIAQVAQERATLDPTARIPTFVYIDECADYLDQNVSLILEQARKFNVGMILANQYIGQLSQKLQESFAANTSIKFAGGVSDKDARALAHMLRCEPEFVDCQPKGCFAASVRNMTSSAVSIRIPFGYLEAMPRMTDGEAAAVRDEMRRRYAVPWQNIGAGPPDKQDDLAQGTSTSRSPTGDPTQPSEDW